MKTNQRFNKVIIFIALFIFIFTGGATAITITYCFADSDNNTKQIYLVYDNNNKIIFEGNQISVGDKIIDNELNEYEIYEVNDTTQQAYAEYNGKYQKPKIHKESKNLNFSNKNIQKSVGLYMTHNDESYVPTDKVSSVYGEGGIHDISASLAECFKSMGYDVYLNNSLHLPHDSKAYSRSESTAKTLLENNIDALFDIHRDGVERSVYVKKVDGIERCKVRIVVGQANPNKDANLQFAMYLVSVAKEYCPWLFLDIYYAKGHYNQSLYNKALLFEMGTYLVEKELVLETVPVLANVIDKTLFSTVVEEDNSLVITDSPTKEQEENIVNSVLNVKTTSQGFWSKYSANILTFCIVFILSMFGILIATNKYNKKRLTKKKSVK